MNKMNGSFILERQAYIQFQRVRARIAVKQVGVRVVNFYTRSGSNALVGYLIKHIL